MYVKLFADLLQSSIWAEDAETCKVWITMLVLANYDGLVRARAPGISHMARVPIQKTRKVLAFLEAPDPESRTPDHEGRRIRSVDGGYMILNYVKYRATEDQDVKRGQWRTSKRRAKTEPAKAHMFSDNSAAEKPSSGTGVATEQFQHVPIDSNAFQHVPTRSNTFQCVPIAGENGSPPPLAPLQSPVNVINNKLSTPPTPSSHAFPHEAQKPKSKPMRVRGEANPEKVNVWKLWVDTWRAVGRTPDPVPIGPDTKAGQQLGKLIRDPTELEEVMRRFLADTDAFILKQGHPLRLLPGRVNAYRGTGATLKDPQISAEAERKAWVERMVAGMRDA